MEIFDEDKLLPERRAIQYQFSSHQIEHESACMRLITWGLIGGIGIPALLILINQTFKT